MLDMSESISTNARSRFAPPQPPTLPSAVFKYQPVRDYVLDSIAASTVHFSSPQDFNDPFDCTISVDFDDISLDEALELRAKLQDDSIRYTGREDDFSWMSPEEVRDRVTAISRKLFDDEKQRFVKTCGVSCFTEVNDSLLMWAHYADGYKGICLEFRPEIIKRLWPVKYAVHFPKFSLVRLFARNDPTQIGELYCVKSEHWSYEREWRAICSRAKYNHVFSGAIKAIYLGTGISDENRERVFEAANASQEQIEIWEARKGEREFRLDFERLT
jgi:Protein of unknown function (DUF2971)